MPKNTKAISFLNELVSAGTINTGAWSFSAVDGNRLLGPDGNNWNQYGKVHLRENTNAEEKTKARYSYPVAKFSGDEIQIYRRGVIAAKAAAAGARGAEKELQIEAAADSLLTAIDKKLEKDGIEITDKMNKKPTDEELDTMGKKKKKADRMDYMPFDGDGPTGSWMTEKMQETPEGYLSGRAIATNVGVFPYLMEDGTVQYELRPPEEVFEPESVRSLAESIMTNDHPNVPVTKDNAKELSVGFTGDVRQDQYHLAPKITVTDSQAIEDVKDGKVALSCGYSCDLEYKSGVWMGVHYDAIQRNIRYNHLAIVPNGRAGDAARLRMDSAVPVGVQIVEDTNNPKGETSSMKITIDGLTYEVQDENLVKVIQTKMDELGTAKADLKVKEDELATALNDRATIEAKADQLKEDNEQLKKDKEALEKADQREKIDAAVKERLKLEKNAEKVGIEIKEDDTNEDIKKAIVLKVYPNAKEKLDSRDSAYLEARYDGTVESLEEENGNTTFKDDTLAEENGAGGGSSQRTDTTDGSGATLTAAKAREGMIDRMKKRSQRKED